MQGMFVLRPPGGFKAPGGRFALPDPMEVENCGWEAAGTPGGFP